MGTRASIHFYYKGDKKPSAIVYRHMDGDPGATGVDLREFLARIQKIQDRRFGSPCHLAARYVVYLAQQFSHHFSIKADKMVPNKDRLDFISVCVVTEDPGDIAYRYKVICSDGGEAPKIECYKIGQHVERRGTRVVVPLERPKPAPEVIPAPVAPLPFPGNPTAMAWNKRTAPKPMGIKLKPFPNYGMKPTGLKVGVTYRQKIKSQRRRADRIWNR